MKNQTKYKITLILLASIAGVSCNETITNPFVEQNYLEPV